MTVADDLRAAATRILARAAAGEVDLRDIAHLMGEKWDQDLIRAMLALASAQPEIKGLDELYAIRTGSAPFPFNRDDLGRQVRRAWIVWAEAQPSPKPSWLVPYDELAEHDKEADRQIGLWIVNTAFDWLIARWDNSDHRTHLRTALAPSVEPGEPTTLETFRASLKVAQDALAEARTPSPHKGEPVAFIVHDDPELGDYLTKSSDAAKRSGKRVTPLFASPPPVAEGMEGTRVVLIDREDGGLRVWSPDLPGLILSGADSARVASAIPAAIKGLRKYAATPNQADGAGT